MSDVDELIGRLAAGPVRAMGVGKVALELGSGATIEVGVDRAADGAARLVGRWQPPAGTGAIALDEVARVAEQTRSALLRCTPSGDEIEIAMTIYLEGLTRHAFVDAVGEIARAHETIDGAVAAFLQHRELIEAAQRSLDETRAAAEEADSRRSDEQRAQNQWQATHTVPDGGLPAWGAPDPSTEPIATLAAGTELQLRQRTGDWAEVAASNGWVGWLDARRLVAR